MAIRKDSDNLVLVAKGGDERADGISILEVLEQFQFVEDAYGAAGDIDLLDGHIMGSARRAFPARG